MAGILITPRVTAGEEAVARWRTGGGGGVGIGQAQAAGGQLIEVRGGDGTGAIATEVTKAQVIGGHNNNIGALFLGHGGFLGLRCYLIML